MGIPQYTRRQRNAPSFATRCAMVVGTVHASLHTSSRTNCTRWSSGSHRTSAGCPRSHPPTYSVDDAGATTRSRRFNRAASSADRVLVGDDESDDESVDDSDDDSVDDVELLVGVVLVEDADGWGWRGPPDPARPLRRHLPWREAGRRRPVTHMAGMASVGAGSVADMSNASGLASSAAATSVVPHVDDSDRNRGPAAVTAPDDPGDGTADVDADVDAGDADE